MKRVEVRHAAHFNGSLHPVSVQWPQFICGVMDKIDYFSIDEIREAKKELDALYPYQQDSWTLEELFYHAKNIRLYKSYGVFTPHFIEK